MRFHTEELSNCQLFKGRTIPWIYVAYGPMLLTMLDNSSSQIECLRNVYEIKNGVRDVNISRYFVYFLYYYLHEEIVKSNFVTHT
jgi:hypothetical protein